jgi:hypothetical protein
VVSKIVIDQWWLDRNVFKAFGLTKSFPINEARYLGGWSEHPEPSKGSLIRLDKDGIAFLRIRGPVFVIPWRDITALEVEGPEQTERRVAAGRLLAFGVLGLAAQKTSRSSVLVVTTTSQGQALFSTTRWNAAELRAKLVPITSRLGSAETNSSPVPVSRMAAADEPADVADPVEQIRRLGELQEQGLLTAEEFTAKKAELLARL